jgi:hypothetical protein
MRRMTSGQGARRARQREEEWLAQNAPQRCVICGRLFIKRREAVCSRECLAKLEKQAKQASPEPQ